MRVYVVTTGSYSDYSIKGIFSTRKRAQRYIDRCLENSDVVYYTEFNDIEEWTLDEKEKEREYTEYSAALFIDNGSPEYPPSQRSTWGIPKSSVYVAEHVPIYKGRGVVRAASHKSAAHAMKLAVEKRQEWLRNKDARGKE